MDQTHVKAYTGPQTFKQQALVNCELCWFYSCHHTAAYNRKNNTDKINYHIPKAL